MSLIECLELILEPHDKYRISDDDGYISIDECIDEENDKWDSIWVFDNYD